MSHLTELNSTKKKVPDITLRAVLCGVVLSYGVLSCALVQTHDGCLQMESLANLGSCVV